jgi:hypothetical protein
MGVPFSSVIAEEREEGIGNTGTGNRGGKKKFLPHHQEESRGTVASSEEIASRALCGFRASHPGQIFTFSRIEELKFRT